MCKMVASQRVSEHRDAALPLCSRGVQQPAGRASLTVLQHQGRGNHLSYAPSQNAFKDYIGALVLHKSSVSGMYLRDDPTILGWELTNSAVCPGDDSGDVVQARTAP